MIPGLWAIADSSPSTTHQRAVVRLAHVPHVAVLLIAGFFARLMFDRKGARGFWVDPSKRILVPLVAGWSPLPDDRRGLDLGADETFAARSARPPPPPPPPGAFPLTHLWFLYYLLCSTPSSCSCRAIVVTLD